MFFSYKVLFAKSMLSATKMRQLKTNEIPFAISALKKYRSKV